MNEFINKINVTLDDLVITKNKGLCEGVSNIFIKNMNKLSLYERPIHCTDVKRETVYIKSDDGDGNNAYWEKDEENKKLKNAINEISYVQQKNLNIYTDKNPDWMDISDKQDEYMLMVRNCTETIKETYKEDKAIKKICNEIYLSEGKNK